VLAKSCKVVGETAKSRPRAGERGDPTVTKNGSDQAGSAIPSHRFRCQSVLSEAFRLERPGNRRTAGTAHRERLSGPEDKCGTRPVWPDWGSY
jgi:hypothetical protein